MDMVIFLGANFREKLARSLEIIFVVLNFVAILSRMRDDARLCTADRKIRGWKIS